MAPSTHLAGWSLIQYILARLLALSVGFFLCPSTPILLVTGGPLFAALLTTLIAATRGENALYAISTPVFPTIFLNRKEVSLPACLLLMAMSTPEKVLTEGEGFSGEGTEV